MDDELITTLLDVLGLLIVAVGVGWCVWPVNPGLGVVAGGIIVLSGSALSARGARSKARE